ncbi:MAG: M43 family zinc metalloprotease [Bacteroidota bacterium]
MYKFNFVTLIISMSCLLILIPQKLNAQILEQKELKRILGDEPEKYWYFLYKDATYRIPNSEELAIFSKSSCGIEDEFDSFEEELYEEEDFKDSKQLDLYKASCSRSSSKIVQVNIHFILKSNGTGNFTESGDGAGRSYNGYQRAEDIITRCNHFWNNPTRQWLPSNNNTPTRNTRIQFILNGTYFHRDNKYFNGVRLNDFSINQKYGKHTNNTINIYLQPKSEAGTTSGIACSIEGTINKDCRNGKSVKIYNGHPTYKRFRGWSLDYTAALINHELGHIFGLRHTWAENDGCADTPNNNNCWKLESGNANCDEWKEISNNLMDYNQYNPPAVTPCQIDRMHRYLSGSLKKFVKSCSSCLPAVTSFTTSLSSSSSCNDVPLTIDGSRSLHERKYKLEIYEVRNSGSTSPVGGTNYTIQKNGQLGVFRPNYRFKANKWYRIKVSSENSCSGWHSQVQYVFTRNSSCSRSMANMFSAEGIPDIRPRNMLKPVSSIKDFALGPNPAPGNTKISFTLSESKKITLSLYDRYGNLISELVKGEELSVGNHQFEWETTSQAIKEDIYVWVLQDDKEVKTLRWSVKY